ncbi:Transglutaminase-like enzyme, putative cysteine protease [Faunimonas pinastri]|uniref:Transglutaminase-like enzyme, putative cysteine protease n=1 Tax=Faunimonas pinastri TaxID=1855383 RepID=A0A1H9D0S4_9HYPH|nr:transglutaminase family protein [Faunimonas pinastri]SEQ06368.1 Transglutaminase-like enzyme, putative cysteine protease [Faunimonas pinastri]
MLNRRRFLLNAGAASLAAPLASMMLSRAGTAFAAEAGKPGEPGWRAFEVTTRVDLADAEGAAQLWLPVIQSAEGYQKASAPKWSTAADSARLAQDPTYAAGILHVNWSGEASPSVEMKQIVSTRDRDASQGLKATADELALELQPTPSMPTDGIVKATAMKIVGDRTRPEDRARAIYDWVVDNTFRDAKVQGCGSGNVRQMLETGYFGGKCADISSLFVALSRAAGIPARDVFGIRVADSGTFKCIGKSGDISKAQHCRAEIYLEPQGWVPVDPADVRKVVLEEKLPLDNPAVQAFRAKSFGNWEMNWVGFNSARDIVLPGGHEREDFLMYPCALTKWGTPDCLNPATFAYSITSREITA